MWVGIQETELKYMKKSVNTWGPGGIVLSKFHQHFRTFMPFIAGSMGLLSRKFWIYNIIASILWAATFVGIGIFFAEYYKEIIKYIQYIMLGSLLAFGIYIWKFKKEAFLKYIEEKNKEVERNYN
jgi:membrane protein DedA with SNARE-associated domain